MKLWSRFRSWPRALFRRARAESEMDAELRFHIDSRAGDLLRSGLSRQEALRRARIEFGGLENFKEECRDANHSNLFDSFLHDVRFALRMLRKSPGFTVVAILTLALGIGANTAIFSVVYAVLLKPLPYPDPAQLVSMFEANVKKGVQETGSSYIDFAQWQQQNRTFIFIAAATRHDLTFTGHGEPAELNTIVVTPDYLPLLGAKPLIGRLFSPGDGKKGAAPVVIVSETFWRGRFGSDPRIVGRPITLDQRPFTVVGVMPAGFRSPFFSGQQDIWIPLAQDPLFGAWMDRRGGHWLPVIGRIRPGVSIAQARADMESVSANLAREFPAEDAGWTVHLTPLQREITGDDRVPLFVLLGAAGLVLLIACANIANLFLARAVSRGREMALRRALGAPRARIIRQLLTESALLGLFGAIAGILCAYWGIHALTSFLPADLPQFHPVTLDLRVLAFALVLSAVASLGFGLAPAVLAARSPLEANLKEGASRSGEGRQRHRARRFLAASEIALALVLIVAAGLLLRSLLALTSVNPGFNVARIVKAEVSLPRFQYTTPRQWNAFANEMLERIQSQPGLRDSALVCPVPLADDQVNLAFSLPGAPPLAPGTPNGADFASVSPAYFRVMEIPLLRGRIFNDLDSPTSPRVAIVGEALARAYFSNGSPIGKQIAIGFPPQTDVVREIVGVVADVHQKSLHQDPGPMVHVPFSQQPFWGSPVVIRTSQSASAVAAAVRQVVWSIDPNLPVTDIASMPDALASSVAEPRFRTWLVGLFGLVALVLSAAGIFGVISYSVSTRTREFGVRLALGARPREILKMVLGEGLRLAAVGLGVGAVAALALAQLLKSVLFGVAASDPLTFIGTATFLLAVALAACYIPARRATRIDPVVALRYE
jgi:putative ABC transport system permease protein